MWRVMWPPLEAHWLASVIIESKFSLHGVISMPDIWIHDGGGSSRSHAFHPRTCESIVFFNLRWEYMLV